MSTDRLRNVAASGLIFLGVFSFYAFCAYPTVAPRDSADLAAAAVTAGVAHPPGYPLYALLGKAWLTVLPWGDPAYRLNLMSAAAGAGTVAAVFMLLARSCGFWPGLGAALALAFSLPLGKFSMLCEMYSLHGLFLAAVLLLAPGPAQAGASRERRAALSALLFGLALVNHQSFILAGPALAALWWGEFPSSSGSRLLTRVCLPLFILGLGLYAFLAVRTGSVKQAWDILIRREYGTWQLSAGFARPLTAELAWRLAGHFAAQLWAGTSPLAAVLAGLGAVELGRRHPRFGLGLALTFLFFGPGFFLMTRFDLSEWVSRTVLETALVVPAVILCVAAGFGLAWLERRRRALVPWAALCLAGWSLWHHAPGLTYRDDFSAYDYARDLRRALPPGSTVVAAGDTALFASRYLDLTRPGGFGRTVAHFQDDVKRTRPGYATGMPLDTLARLGWPAGSVRAAGLVQCLAPVCPLFDFWELSVLRRSDAMRRGESYAHDIRLAYAFAHYLSGQRKDAAGDGEGAAPHYVRAAALDPEDYQIEYNTAR